jgi:hypothetical protein
MFLPEDFTLEPTDKTAYAQARVPDRTYISKSFSLPRPGSMDHGQPARFAIKVFDTETETTIEQHGEEWILRETPAGRYQVKFLLAREAGNIKEIWIERVPASGIKGDISLFLNLKSRGDIERFFQLVDIVREIQPDGGETVRLDDGIIRDILASPETLDALYRREPEKFRSLIENDVSAGDVIALASRRDAVNKFGRMLSDDQYFDSLIASEGSGKPEGVWQNFFESNPWILGVSAASQLLTSLDPAKLEQVVDGRDITGPGKRADALMRTAGKIRSVVLLELKTHRTSLLHSEYRPGCWVPSKELVGGIAQSQGTVYRAVRSIGERYQSLAADGSEVPNDFSYLIRPKSLLIIGKLDELQSPTGGDHRDKIRSFELFRRSSLEPEIVTYDELYAKAQFIVENDYSTAPEPVLAIQQSTAVGGHR